MTEKPKRGRKHGVHDEDALEVVALGMIALRRSGGAEGRITALHDFFSDHFNWGVGTIRNRVTALEQNVDKVIAARLAALDEQKRVLDIEKANLEVRSIALRSLELAALNLAKRLGH